MGRKFGFTLAEVLITLAIIGMVAALTIPTLVANYQKRQFVVQLQKTYATIANAAKMVMADEQVDNLNNTYLREPDEYDDYNEMYENSVGKFLKTYFKVVKTCNIDDSSCYAESYKSQDDTIEGQFIGTYTDRYCGVLSSGTVICMAPFTEENPITFSIDVNGKTGPNIMGRDAFQFAMNYRGELAEQFPVGSADSYRCGDDEQALTYSIGCFTKIIQDGWKMDY